MKKTGKIILIISLILCVLIIGSIIFSGGNKMQKYISKDGWSVEYNDGAFELSENEKDVTLKYIKKSKGEDSIRISYYPGKTPREILSRMTCSFPPSMLEKSEGYFGNGFENWAFTTSLANGSRGNGLAETFTAVEHNGGTVLIRVIYYQEPFIDGMVTVSDDISAVLDTFELIDHQPQKLLSHIPGIYVNCDTGDNEKEYLLTLNDDHTGTLGGADKADLIWTSGELIDLESDERASYRSEDGRLYVQIGKKLITFQKKQ